MLAPTSQPLRDYRILDWQHDFAPVEPLIEAHLQRVAMKLHRAAARLPDAVRNLYGVLPLEACARLITSPNVAEIVLVAEEQPGHPSLPALYKQLADFIIAEALVAGMPVPEYPTPRATALGDVVFDPQLKPLAPPLRTRLDQAIDYNSYLHNNSLSGVSGYSTEEALNFKTIIDDGLTFIGSVAPHALDMIRRCIVYIHLRRSPRLGNSSTHIGIGKIQSEGFHVIAEKPEEVIDFLVHESIHSLLHLFEAHRGRFHRPEAVAEPWFTERNIVSPWSGNRIDLSSYTHAILVWYGLLRFWTLAREHPTSLIPASAIERMVAQAERGFLATDDPFAHIPDEVAYLEPEYVAMARQCHRAVRKRETFALHQAITIDQPRVQIKINRYNWKLLC